MKFDVGDTVTVKGFGGKYEDGLFTVVQNDRPGNYPYQIANEELEGWFSNKYLVLVDRAAKRPPVADLDPTMMIGQQIRANHRHAFRPGEWATITGASVFHPYPLAPRMIWTMEWPDGVTDTSPVFSYEYEYEFRITWPNPGWPITRNA